MQISAIERLQGLPPLFRGADLTVRFQWTSKTASQYLYLWKKRKLVEELGGHSYVFANLLVGRQPDWHRALLLAMPSALLIGIDALRYAGWTTQIPHRPVIAVNSRQPVFSSNRFEIVQRDPKWFASVADGVMRDNMDGLPRLAPAWALAELLSRGDWGECGLFPDDIEWHMLTPDDETQWSAACKTFGLARMPLSEMVVAAR